MVPETIHVDGVGFNADFARSFPTVTDYLKEALEWPHWTRESKKNRTEKFKIVYKIAHNGK